MKQQTPSRLPRYHRSKNPPPFQLTERDIRMLEHLYLLRLLDQQQLQRLEFTTGGASACKRRLTLLFHGGYVDRRYAPRTVPYGAPRAAYCLDRRGAELVAAHRGVRVEELDWRRDDAVREALFLVHSVMTNDVFVAFRSACTRRAYGLEWQSERILRRELAGKHVSLPGGDQRLAPIPDAHAVVGVQGADFGFAVELDRGTVEEKRVREKVHAYGAWVRSGEYRRLFPGPALRVLFVVAAEPRSTERLERLVRWCEAEHAGSLFWFAEHDRLAGHDIVSEPMWRVAGSRVLHALFEPGDTEITVRTSRQLPTIR
jgi:hypothetical protein